MIFRWLADLTVIAHFAFIAFVLFGSLLVRRWPGVARLHVLMLAWAVGVEAVGWSCPLTLLEKWLRVKGGWGGYLGDFVDHWIIAPLFDPGTVSPPIRSLFGLVPVAVSAFGYWRAWRAHRFAKSHRAQRSASVTIRSAV